MCHPRLSFSFGPQINFIIGMFCISSLIGLFFSKTLTQVTTEVRLFNYSSFLVNKLSRYQKGGKSAVLSALTIALGGKAITTGRGSGLKAFIREGQP